MGFQKIELRFCHKPESMYLHNVKFTFNDVIYNYITGYN